jgi:hypothetical protein
MRVGKFYKECGRRAFSGKFWLVEKWSAGLAVLTAIAAAFIPSTLLHLTELEMARWTTLIPVYFFVFVFVIAVISGFIIAPSKMYQEQVELKIAADEKRKPKLRLFLNSSSLEVLKKASTSQSLGGQLFTAKIWAKNWPEIARFTFFRSQRMVSRFL